MTSSSTITASRNTDSDSMNPIPIVVEVSPSTSRTNEDQVETPKNSNRENNLKRTNRIVEVEESDEVDINLQGTYASVPISKRNWRNFSLYRSFWIVSF